MSEQEVLQRNLINFIVSDVFNVITEDDIFKQMPNGEWTHKGKVLSPGVCSAIAKEALAFSKTKLFDMLVEEIRYHGKERLIESSSEADMFGAKLTSYFADILRAKLTKLSSMKPLKADA